jgi:hypothetical protein
MIKIGSEKVVGSYQSWGISRPDRRLMPSDRVILQASPIIPVGAW